MNGNVFQCYEEHADPTQYTKTLDTLDSYAKKTFKYTSDFAALFAWRQDDRTRGNKTNPSR